MKTKDHLALGHFLLNLSDNAGLQKHKRAFLLGCIEPDYNMATYTRGLRNHPKFRGHNAENSYRHITKCLSEFQSDGICSAWDYFTLGTMLHYIADAFTYPHNSFWKGSLLKHAAYEMELHILAVVGLTLLRSGDGIIGKIDFLNLQFLQYIYLLEVGMLAIVAMMLPGISGSTILLIAGVYVPTISAAKQLLSLNIAVLPGLIALGFGVLLGVGVSIHSIRAAMKKHRSQMVYLILGLILGSLFAIVMGPTTLAEPVPALSFSTFDFLSFAIGVAVLFGLELLKKTMPGKNPANSTAEGDDDDEH